MKKKMLGAVLAVVLVGVAGCGDTATTTEPAPQPAAAEDSVSKEELDKAVDEAVAKAKAEKPAPTPDKSKVDQMTEDAEKGDSGDTRAVPDVTAMDHQLAQDTLQAEGFYLLDEIDCSGEDRMLLWDRNWTVQEQKPAPGTEASVDATITLCSVKDGE